MSKPDAPPHEPGYRIADGTGDFTTAARPAGLRPYFPELDGVRAVAVIMVMAFHFSQEWRWYPPMIFGQTGVDLFFVLSGFLITTILLQSPHGSWDEVRKFYTRRTLRIFPLYYGYLIVGSLIGVSIPAWYWVYLQNMPLAVGAPLAGPVHFWSLAVEEQFYLLWPFLVLFAPRRHLLAIMGSIVVATFVLRLGLAGTHVDVFYFTFTRFDGLAAGGILAILHHRRQLAAWRMAFLGLLAASLVLLLVQWRLSHGQGVIWVQGTKTTAATLLYAASIGVVLTTGGSPVHRLLAAAPLRAIGRVSYGMYVFHPLVFAVVPAELSGVPLAGQAGLAFVAVFLVATASWYGFERGFIVLKTRLAPEKRFADIQRRGAGSS